MEKQVTPGEWKLMELLWEKPRTLMELVNDQTMGWSKSTVTTMVRRMDEKGLITYETLGRAKHFRAAVAREDVVARETDSLLLRAYQGSVGLLVSAMASRHNLTQADIEELYEILKDAEADLK